jgi:hypothetical protein
MPATKTRRRPNPRDVLLKAVKRGDINSVVQVLATADDLFMIDPGERLRILQQAIAASAKKGLRAQVESVLSTAFALDSEILAVQQVAVRQALNAASARYGLQGGASAVKSEELDKLLRIEVHVTQLAKVIASVRHVLTISDQAEALRADRSVKRRAALRLVVNQEADAHADAAGG